MIVGPRLSVAAAFAVLLAHGCAGRPSTGTGQTGALPERRGGDAALGFDVASFYQQAGLLAGPPPVAFVGTVHFLASATPDTTLMLVGVSLPNSALTFIRENDRYRAGYEIRALLRQAGSQVEEVSAREEVRVGSFGETTRPDESVIFQEFVRVPPGDYQLQLVVRDLESARTATAQAELAIPRYVAGHLASPVPVHEADARERLDTFPELIASPRATAIYGRDSTITVYLEAYGPQDEIVPVQLAIRGAQGAILHSDSIVLPRSGALFATTIHLPVWRMGIGATTLAVMRADTRDSSVTPIIVGFGDDLPLVTFDQMLDYLQYFASISRLRDLREADPESRVRQWAAFVRETDPDPGTPENEALLAYFRRVAYANQRFREEGSLGWRSDRGMVYVALGEPDQVLEQTRSEFGTRGRLQVWEYRQHRLQLVFVDQTGFGRWRLTPGSETEFRSVFQRLRAS